MPLDACVGEIRMFAGTFAPTGWAFCDGQLLAINDNQALFSILGTTYGGDGRTTFGLPDLRGRVPVHPGDGAGLTSRSLGERGGTETNTLTTNQLPAHNHSHSVPASTGAANTTDPTDAVPAVIEDGNRNAVNAYSDATADVVQASANTDNTGGGQSVNNMQPFLGVHYIIALVGTFPT